MITNSSSFAAAGSEMPNVAWPIPCEEVSTTELPQSAYTFLHDLIRNNRYVSWCACLHSRRGIEPLSNSIRSPNRCEDVITEGAIVTTTSSTEATWIGATEEATVFIVDDEPVARRTVSLLARSVGLAAESYPSAQEFLAAYDPQKRGCLTLDLRMPGMTGMQLQQELASRGIEIPIIFLTAHGEVPSATAAMRAGAVDFIPKPFSSEVLLERIHEAIAIDARQHRDREHQNQLELRISTLTDREHEVMQLLAVGDSTKVIAKRLGISSKTVDNHRAKILEKMGVDNPTQLAHLVANHA